jgi:Ca-activated chloride channel family protein
MFRGASTAVIVRSVVLTAVLGLLAAAVPAQAASTPEPLQEETVGSVILVLDSSGSMAEKSGGRTRMESAKKGLTDVIAAVPDGSSVGLRVYGASIEDGPGSCEDSDLLVPVETVDRDKLTDEVKGLEPLGNTPIAFSLEKAAKDLPDEGPRSIVLVSDGEENCDGDPCQVAEDIRDSGVDVHVDVVGLEVDAASREQLTCIASAGGGTYYDVPDASKLPGTLTKVAVRGARGYEPAGAPVEGGTSAAEAVSIDDGQWLDTIGDSKIEHYTVDSPGKGTLHLAATLRPVGLGTADGAAVTLQVSTADGEVCGEPVRANAIGVVSKSTPITATASMAGGDLESCGEGPYVVAVDATGISSVQPLEVLVTTERGVTGADDLPAAAGADELAESGDAPSTPTPAIGAPSFSAAPTLGPGTYTDTLLGGETLFYKVRVDWGQQLVCDATIGENPQADPYGELRVAAQAYDANRAVIDQSPAGDAASQLYDASKDVQVVASSVPVRYNNRTAQFADERVASVPGTYYCGVFANAQPTQIEGFGELPVTLTVSVLGNAGEGKPDYVKAEGGDGDVTDGGQAASDDDGGIGAGWIIGGVVLLLAILGVVLALVLRSRRRPAGPSAPPGPPAPPAPPAP